MLSAEADVEDKMRILLHNISLVPKLTHSFDKQAAIERFIAL